MPDSAPLPDGLAAIAIGKQGLHGWSIDTPACQALVSRQGAQLLAFQARGQAPLLWCSPLATRAPGKAIRGGIPLCFPWFGPHPADAGKPTHGFARQRDWTLVATRQLAEALQLEFTLAADDATRALWPHDFLATLSMTLGHAPALQLTVTNTGAAPFRFAFAWHSYFPLADSRRARVEGLEGSLCIDQRPPGRPRHRQQGIVRFQGETDCIFLHTRGHCRLVDELRQQVWRIEAEGCRSVIAWNPGPEKTARLADMPPGAWQEMACVETGNVEDDAPILSPGESGTFHLQIR